jgi:TRAP-type C4-dicarboxylate transport system substrate-binding protein
LNFTLPVDKKHRAVFNFWQEKHFLTHEGDYAMKLSKRSLIRASVATLCICSMSVAAAQSIKLLRFAEFGPNRGDRAGTIKWLDAEMRKRSGGKLGLDIVWGGALLGAKDAAKGLSAGVADMASIVPVYAPGRMVVYEVVDTLQFPNEWVGMMATYELMTTHPEAKAEMDKFNLRYFGNYTTGPTQILTKGKAVKSLGDLKGLKIRATGAFVPAMKKYGAATVSTPQPKVYEALSNGSVDGSTTYYYVVKAYKQYEVADHMTEVNMGQTLGFGIAMNKGTYDSLPRGQQKMLDQLGKDYTQHVAKVMFESRTQTKAELAAGIGGKKITMHDAPPAMRKALIEVAEADAANWVSKANGKGLPGGKILDDYRALVNKYQKIKDTKGHPWD